MEWVGLSSGAIAHVREPYLACNHCGLHHTGLSYAGMDCCAGAKPPGRKQGAHCPGKVIDVGAEVAKIVPTYDPAWWIVTTGDNVINPRWETPRRHVSEWDKLA